MPVQRGHEFLQVVLRDEWVQQGQELTYGGSDRLCIWCACKGFGESGRHWPVGILQADRPELREDHSFLRRNQLEVQVACLSQAPQCSPRLSPSDVPQSVMSADAGQERPLPPQRSPRTAPSTASSRSSPVTPAAASTSEPHRLRHVPGNPPARPIPPSRSGAPNESAGQRVHPGRPAKNEMRPPRQSGSDSPRPRRQADPRAARAADGLGRAGRALPTFADYTARQRADRVVCAALGPLPIGPNVRLGDTVAFKIVLTRRHDRSTMEVSPLSSG